MKALTLHQPWATLIANEVKTIETRSWAPSPSLIGERIAIHAGRTVANVGLPQAVEDLLVALTDSHAWWQKIPTGVILATAVLDHFWQVGRVENGIATGKVSNGDADRSVQVNPLADFSLGRYLWFLTNVQKVDPPVPIRGAQKLWEWPVAGPPPH